MNRLVKLGCKIFDSVLRFLGLVEHHPQVSLEEPDRLRQVLYRLAVLPDTGDDGVENLADLVDEPGDRGVRADRVALPAGRAVFRATGEFVV